MTEPRLPARRSNRRAVAARLATGALILLVLTGAWLGFRMLQVQRALSEVEPLLSDLSSDFSDLDTESAAARLAPVPDAAARAHAATSDPVWRAAEHLPWAGAQFDAVARVSEALDVVAIEVLPQLDEIATGLDPASLVPVDGRIDVESLAAVAPAVHTANQGAQQADDLVAAIDPEALVPMLAGRVIEAQDALDKIASLLNVGDRVLTVAPAMLGADAPREYLLLVQNPAELRTLGGIVGAVAVLRADDGRIDLADYTPVPSLGLSEPALPLTEAELTLYTARLGTYLQDVTMTPDLPRASELAVAMWQGVDSEQLDGVVTMDPGALAALLGATGSVQVGDVTLTEDNVVRALLYDSYVTYPDPADSDEFFASAASAVFDALIGSDADADPRALLDGVRQAVDERRIGLWSAHDDEQTVIASGSVGSAFLSGADADAVGLFFDDGSQSKIDWFLDTDVTLECRGSTATVTAELVSTVPVPDPGLPDYLLGRGDLRGIAQTNITVWSPVGGRVLAVQSDGQDLPSRWTEDAGRQAAVVTVSLGPGDRAQVVATVDVGEVSRPSLRTTPTIGSPGWVDPTHCAVD